MTYEDIAERMALIAQLAEPLTCSPDDESGYATMIQELAQWKKTPAQIKEELADDPDWDDEED